MFLASAGEYINWCLKQERLAETLYIGLSNHSEVPESARAVFIDLAKQEQEHYNSLSFAKRVLRSSSELDNKIELSTDEIADMKAYDRRIQEVSLEGLSFPQALELANDLESQFYEIHCLLERTTESRELKAVFRKLRTGDHEHFETLSRLMELHT